MAFGSLAATLIVDPGAVFSGNVTGNIAVTDALGLAAGQGPGTLDMGGSFSGLSVFGFAAGSEWTLEGSRSVLPGPSITGFAAHDTLVVEGFVAVPASTTFTGSGLVLTDSAAGSVTLAIQGAFQTRSFAVTFNAGGGTDVAYVACFAAGTRIGTPGGEVRIEALRIGDRVVSGFGGSVPIAWIGRRRIECRRHPRPAEVWPVRVRADAFAPGRPSRDLCLSPDHAVYVDDVLIPIRTLVNGTTIVQEPRDAIVYFHLELPQHDVIHADGLPAESYLDTGNRSAFEDGGPAQVLHPDFAQMRVERGGVCAADHARAHPRRRRRPAAATRNGPASPRGVERGRADHLRLTSPCGRGGQRYAPRRRPAA